MKNISSYYVLVCKGLWKDGAWVAWGTVFQEMRPGAGFKTGDFVKENIYMYMGGLPWNDSPLVFS